MLPTESALPTLSVSGVYREDANVLDLQLINRSPDALTIADVVFHPHVTERPHKVLISYELIDALDVLWFRKLPNVSWTDDGCQSISDPLPLDTLKRPGEYPSGPTAPDAIGVVVTNVSTEAANDVLVWPFKDLARRMLSLCASPRIKLGVVPGRHETVIVFPVDAQPLDSRMDSILRPDALSSFIQYGVGASMVRINRPGRLLSVAWGSREQVVYSSLRDLLPAVRNISLRHWRSHLHSRDSFSRFPTRRINVNISEAGTVPIDIFLGGVRGSPEGSSREAALRLFLFGNQPSHVRGELLFADADGRAVATVRLDDDVTAVVDDLWQVETTDVIAYDHGAR